MASGIPDIKFMFMSYSDIRLLFRVRLVWGHTRGLQSDFSLGGALRRPLSGQGRTGIANHLHAPQATGPLPSSLPVSQYEGLQALALWEACGRLPESLNGFHSGVVWELGGWGPSACQHKRPPMMVWCTRNGMSNGNHMLFAHHNK